MINDQNNQDKLIDTFIKTKKRFFPKLGEVIAKIPDPRIESKITYELPILIWMGIFGFLFCNGVNNVLGLGNVY